MKQILNRVCGKASGNYNCMSNIRRAVHVEVWFESRKNIVQVKWYIDSVGKHYELCKAPFFWMRLGVHIRNVIMFSRNWIRTNNLILQLNIITFLMGTPRKSNAITAGFFFFFFGCWTGGYCIRYRISSSSHRLYDPNYCTMSTFLCGDVWMPWKY